VMKTARDVDSVRAAVSMGCRCIMFPPGGDTSVLKAGWEKWVPELRKAIS